MTSRGKYRKSLIILTFILLIVGIMALISASSVLGAEDFNDVFYYVKKQLFRGILIGLILMFLVSRFNYHHWAKLSLILLVLNLLLVGLCFLGPFKYVVNGAHRWLKVGPLVFQPSEFLKISYILFLAAILAKANTTKVKKVLAAPFIIYIISLGAIGLLLSQQPSTGTFLILAGSSVAMYLTVGLSWKQFFILLLGGGLFLAMLITSTGYRSERIQTFLSGESDPLGKGYQTQQSLIGIGSGGIFGVGFGNSVQKFNYLPASHTDAIFSIIAEEFGFLGSLCLLIIYLFFISSGLGIAQHSPDSYGKFLTTGFISSIGIQAFINIAAMCKLIPITGIPLPFISYGSSALITNLFMVGVVINISKSSS